MNDKKLNIIIVFLLIFISPNMWGQHTWNILDVGGINDGKTINTDTIQSAINHLSNSGGGKLVFTKGKYLTGCLQLKSNVKLYLEKGAVLLGSTNPFDYSVLNIPDKNVVLMHNDYSSLALIQAYKVHNISICGEGCIDGQGLELVLNIDSLHHAGVLVDPNYNTRRKRPSENVRPKMFFFSGCNDVEVKGTHLKNSASWGLTFDSCSNLQLNGLSILNRAFWNNDGIDVIDCKNVNITNCSVNSADDGICLKSYHPESFNDSINISNCNIISSASAIKFGTASSGGFKNITINHIKVYDTFRSAIAIESVDGGIIENIRISNLIAKNTGNPIFIRLGHRSGSSVGLIRNIYISNIKIEVPFGRPDINYNIRGPEVSFFHNSFPSVISGFSGHNIENIHLKNIEITYPGRASKGMAYVPLYRLNQVPEFIRDYPEFSMFGELPAWGFYIRHVKGITFNNIKLKLKNDDFRPALVLDDVTGHTINNLLLPKEKNKKQVVLKDVTNLSTNNIDSNSIMYVK
ncbi:MAG: glycosyl hydrolase family 28 protein [Bacteroidaceae bacterium]|nr:glycosyl hydrolase family 28 protein [Bacteroidaceae bacterium]